ncbi:MAG TPA: nuclear transport factor 2 family protein [Candidatus Dormibacteraeota bacterium]|nr:nuclear transport factor 2 family protein [Candidatus Dormibacteraeota bacterium]
MIATDVVHRYFDAWNHHDPQGVLATFAEAGTYEDPTTGGPLSGDAIVQMTDQFFKQMPDASFEVVTESLTPDGVAAQWLMRAYGGAVALPGADFITMEGGGILSVRGYFDQKGLRDQMAKVLPLTFGDVTYFGTGRQTRPGAISLTVLNTRTDDERRRVGDLSRQIVTEMAASDNFISFSGLAVGDRMMTLTAWTDAESAHRGAMVPAHRAAIREFYDAGLSGAGGTLSVWTNESMKLLVHCRECDRISDWELTQTCSSCGKRLEAQPYI